jgi:AMMECR1 domain-containing protein
MDHLDVHVSVLGPLDRVDASSLPELMRAIRPGLDGVLVIAGHRRGTFLPSVWSNVGGREEFFRLLWRKAGLRAGTWPRSLRAFRYQSTDFGS